MSSNAAILGALSVSLLMGLPAGCTGSAEPDAGSPDYPAGPYGSEEGSVLENFALTDLEREAFPMMRVHDSDHPAALLYVTANWCFTCGPEVAWLNAQADARPGLLSLIAVVEAEDFEAPDVSDGETFRERYSASSTVLIDPEGATTPYRDIAIPLNLLVTTDDMVIRFKAEGFDQEALEAAVDEALGDSP